MPGTAVKEVHYMRPALRSIGAEIVKVSDGDGWDIEGVASLEVVDSYGELILMSAFSNDVLTAYMRNPLFMLLHPLGWNGGTIRERLPIGQVVKIWVEGPRLLFRAKFSSTDLAQEVKTLYREGSLRMFSIGFYPSEGGSRAPYQDEVDKHGVDLKLVTEKIDALAEVSGVPLGANPGAFTVQVKAMLAAIGVKAEGMPDLQPQVDGINAAMKSLADACNELIKAAGSGQGGQEGGDEEEPAKEEDQQQEEDQEKMDLMSEHLARMKKEADELLASVKTPEA